MNKFVALALAACLFSAVSAQNGTTTATTTTTTPAAAAGNGTTGSWCRANTDCTQKDGFCCSSTSTGALGYIQFNCNKHTSGSASVGKCINNVTNDFTEACVGQTKTCTSSVTKATYCGGSLTMAAIDLLPDVSCTSSAYTLVMSVAFFAMIAISYAL